MQLLIIKLLINYVHGINLNVLMNHLYVGDFYKAAYTNEWPDILASLAPISVP